jgi:hypothetical protein
MTENINMLYENMYFKFYLSGENKDCVNLDSTTREHQEKFIPEEVLSYNDKVKYLHETIEYFYNFWKFIETSGDTKIYTMYFNINELMIKNAWTHLFKVAEVFKKLKTVIKSNVKETYFKIESQNTKNIFDFVLTMYKPLKPIHLIK